MVCEAKRCRTPFLTMRNEIRRKRYYFGEEARRGSARSVREWPTRVQRRELLDSTWHSNRAVEAAAKYARAPTRHAPGGAVDRRLLREPPTEPRPPSGPPPSHQKSRPHHPPARTWRHASPWPASATQRRAPRPPGPRPRWQPPPRRRSPLASCLRAPCFPSARPSARRAAAPAPTARIACCSLRGETQAGCEPRLLAHARGFERNGGFSCAPVKAPHR